MHYRKPDGLCVDIALFTIIWDEQDLKIKRLPTGKLGIFLVKRDNLGEPYHDHFALPGGFTTPEETIDGVAYRKLKAKVGLEGIDLHLEQLPVRYSEDRDPRGWIPTVPYFGLVSKDKLSQAHAAQDVSEVKLVAIDDLGDYKLAFDHRDIIDQATEKVIERICTSTLIKELLPEEFTLAHLYNTVKIVVPDFKVIKTNFVRDMTSSKSRSYLINQVLDDNGNPTKSDEFGPPAALYKFTDKKFTLNVFSTTIFDEKA